ncbi:MAG TPA: hypothetical protein VMT36_00840 [Candidatus Saccharimonadia bacterium]|nr:hypothetical protein [Candidatus Saccharimonadia bacterium]
MSNLLRLYPQAWRDRYGDELLAVLEDRPASLTDYLDLMRGALDARLHPQVRGTATPDKESSMNQRVLALSAFAGGVFWMAGFAAWLTSPLDVTGDHSSTLAIPLVALSIALMGIGIGELGTRPGDDGSPFAGHLIAGTSVVLAVLLPLPTILNLTDALWGIIVLALFGFPVIAALGAGRAQRNGVLPTWLMLAIFGGAISAWVGYGGSTPDSAKWVGLFLGLAFLLLGSQALLVTRRRLDPSAS